jgi:predicted Fe-S protein YdhL (DUF1289 family)
MKRCSQCGEWKPLEAFGKLRRAKDGRRSYCRGCGRKYSQAYRLRHKARMAERHALWVSVNRQHYREYQKFYQRWYRLYGPVNEKPALGK